MSDRPNQFRAAESLREDEMTPASPTAVKRFLSDGPTDGVTGLADGVLRATSPGGDLQLASAGDSERLREGVSKAGLPE